MVYGSFYKSLKTLFYWPDTLALSCELLKLGCDWLSRTQTTVETTVRTTFVLSGQDLKVYGSFHKSLKTLFYWPETPALSCELLKLGCDWLSRTQTTVETTVRTTFVLSGQDLKVYGSFHKSLKTLFYWPETPALSCELLKLGCDWLSRTQTTVETTVRTTFVRSGQDLMVYGSFHKSLKNFF